MPNFHFYIILKGIVFNIQRYSILYNKNLIAFVHVHILPKRMFAYWKKLLNRIGIKSRSYESYIEQIININK